MMPRRPVIGALALAVVVSLVACAPAGTDPPGVEPAVTTTVTVTETVSATANPEPSPSPSAEDVPYQEPHAGYFAGSRVSEGTTYLSVDVVLFLGGIEAEDAAEAAGEEPPPNDFFILNQSTRLREYAVEDGLMVEIVIDETGMVCSTEVCPPMTLDAWLTALKPAESVLRMLPYWITIEAETITSIRQQYLP